MATKPLSSGPKKKIKKAPIPLPDLSEEVRLGFFHSPVQLLVIGVDEVGRGCLAGPVVAAAAVLCPERTREFPQDKNGKRIKRGKEITLFKKSKFGPILEVRDSKLIPEPERAPLASVVREFVKDYAIGEASVEEIEKLNILYASHLSMERAVANLEKKLGRPADQILVDGHIVPRVFLGRGTPIIGGDGKSLSIACASILAKVFRDEMMLRFDGEFPGYNFKENKGYGTPIHRKKIAELGITSIHRKTFAGVKEHNLAAETLELEF